MVDSWEWSRSFRILCRDVTSLYDIVSHVIQCDVFDKAQNNLLGKQDPRCSVAYT